MLHAHLLTIKGDEIVALRRRHLLSHFQKIQRGGQGHLREAAYLEAAHAEQEPRGEALAEEFQGVFLAVHSSGENKNQIGAAREISLREPGPQSRQSIGSVLGIQALTTITHSKKELLRSASGSGGRTTPADTVRKDNVTDWGSTCLPAPRYLWDRVAY